MVKFLCSSGRRLTRVALVAGTRGGVWERRDEFIQMLKIDGFLVSSSSKTDSDGGMCRRTSRGREELIEIGKIDGFLVRNSRKPVTYKNLTRPKNR